MQPIQEALMALAANLESSSEGASSIYTQISSEHLLITHVTILYEHFEHPSATNYQQFKQQTYIDLFERIHRDPGRRETHVIKFRTNDSPQLLRSYIMRNFSRSTSNVPDQATEPDHVNIGRPSRTRRPPSHLQDFTQGQRRSRSSRPR